MKKQPTLYHPQIEVVLKQKIMKELDPKLRKKLHVDLELFHSKKHTNQLPSASVQLVLIFHTALQESGDQQATNIITQIVYQSLSKYFLQEELRELEHHLLAQL